MPDIAPLVLDTHVLIWLVDGNPELPDKTRNLINAAAEANSVLIPAICVWEVAKLTTSQRLVLRRNCRDWTRAVLAQPGIQLVPLSAEIALESCFLPGKFHEDPADRFIIATARLEEATIVTRDKRILNYAKQGFVDAIAV